MFKTDFIQKEKIKIVTNGDQIIEELTQANFKVKILLTKPALLDKFIVIL